MLRIIRSLFTHPPHPQATNGAYGVAHDGDTCELLISLAKLNQSFRLPGEVALKGSEKSGPGRSDFSACITKKTNRAACGGCGVGMGATGGQRQCTVLTKRRLPEGRKWDTRLHNPLPHPQVQSGRASIIKQAQLQDPITSRVSQSDGS